jgi:diguanylate cyclase (GGDEF)-like protein
LKAARNVAERIREAVAAEPFRAGEIDIRVTVSIGVSGFGGLEYPETAGVDLLLRQADECLYRSKRAGRNRVTLCSRDPPA